MDSLKSDLPSQPFCINFQEYSEADSKEIKRFMEETEYPHFTMPRGSRDGKFVVEMPNIPEAQNFKDLMLTEMPEEIQSCHPLLRRRDIFIRFVSELEEPQEDGSSIGTNCDILDVREDGKIKYYIRIALDNLNDVNGDDMVSNLVGMIAHEIAETDYYLKSGKHIEDSKELLGTDQYSYTEDEEIANRRSLRVLKRKYPDAKWIGVQYDADEIK